MAQVDPGDPTQGTFPGRVLQQVVIDAGASLGIPEGEQFGTAIASLGDLDGDGVDDLIASSRMPAVEPADGIDQGFEQGALWVLFLNPNGSLRSYQQIAQDVGGFTGPLEETDEFGSSIANLGDLDGDGVVDIAVGARRSDFDGALPGGSNRGAVWILFLNADGTVKAQQKIADEQGGFGNLSNQDEFGSSVALLGDLDDDGVQDIAVGARKDDDGGGGDNRRGAVWILFMNTDGTVDGTQKISAEAGGFTGELDVDDEFGFSMVAIGDLDADGNTELAVGTGRDDDGGPDRGAVYILKLDDEGLVKSHVKISEFSGGLAAALGDDDGSVLDDEDAFGYAVGAPGDVDGDEIVDLIVGARGDDDGGTDRGAAYMLFLNEDGSVSSALKYSSTEGGLSPGPVDEDFFGSAVAASELLEDGSILVPVGSRAGAGAVNLLFVEGPPQANSFESPTTDSFSGLPGRIVLLPPPPLAGDDAVDQPIVVVPRSGEGTIRLETGNGALDVEGGTGFDNGGEFLVGNDPGMTGTGNFGTPGGSGPTFPSYDGEDPLVFTADIVVTNRGGDSFSLLRTLGDDYAPHIEFPLAPFNGAPVALAVGDFDNDLLDDVSIAGNQGVSTFLGDGLGGFPIGRFMPLDLLTDMQAGFVNGDAFLDLVVTSGRRLDDLGGTEEGYATVLLGNGDGTFMDAGRFAEGRAVASVLLGDLKGDASLDALVTVHEVDGAPNGEPMGRIELWVGDGLGGFAPEGAGDGGLATVFEVPNPQGIHPTFGSLRDLNNDGLLDAVYTSNDNIARPLDEFAEEQPPVFITVLENSAGGGFIANIVGTAYAGKGVNPILEDIVVDDDENIDSVIVWSGDVQAGLGGVGASGQGLTSFITLMQGTGSSTFVDPAPNQYATGNNPGDGAIGELISSGGGLPQLGLVIPNTDDNSLSVFKGDGTGNLSQGLIIRNVDDTPVSAGMIAGPRSLSLANLNNDGTLDLVTYNEARTTAADGAGGGTFVQASIAVFLNAAEGAFKVQDFPLPRGGEIDVGDVTLDGAPDLVVTQRLGAGAEELRVYEGLGDGMFDTAAILPVEAGLHLTGGLAVRDVNDDGLRDIVTTAADEDDRGYVLVYLNAELSEGEPGSSLAATAFDMEASWTEIRSIDFGDTNGDFFGDVLIGSRDARLIVARGDGAGAFSPAETNTSAQLVGGGALRVGNLNGDAKLDVANASRVTDTSIDQAFVRSLIGKGDGTFKVKTVGGLSSTGPENALRPLIGDLDNDGADDLVLIHGTANSLSVLTNQLSRFEPYGIGKAGSGGITPVLRGRGYTTPGGQIEILAEDTVGGTLGLFLIGVGRVEDEILAMQTIVAQVVVGLGGEVGVPGAGGLTLAFTLPNNAEYVGADIALQMLVLDPDAGGNPFNLALSNGLGLVIVQ